MKELLKAGYELNATYSEGDTTLIFASSEGHVDCVKDLIAAGADVNIGSDEIVCLMCSSQGNNWVLKAVADVNATDDADKALMVAVNPSGDESIVDIRLLLESGADVIT